MIATTHTRLRRALKAGHATSWIVVRALIVGLMLAGALSMAVSSHAPAQGFASLQVKVHSCPDDLEANGFYQYGQQCTSGIGLFGVPLHFAFADDTDTTLYTQPEGDESALAMVLPEISAGIFTISEVSDTRVRESVVFCSVVPAAGGAGELDGTEVPVVNGEISLNVADGDGVFCEWYRFPGGIASEPDPDDSGPPPEQGEETGGAILIQKWFCDLAEVDTSTETDEPAEYLAELQASCEPAIQGYDFDLADDADDGQDYPEQTIGGQETSYLGWSELEPAEYSISEDLPADFEEPTVICEGEVPGQENVRPNLVKLEAHHGGVSYDLAENETLTCEWFNFASVDQEDGAGADVQQGDTEANDQEDDAGATDQEGDTGANDQEDAAGTDNQEGNPGVNDQDDDGIIDADEAALGTDPQAEDSDDDGIGDGDEGINGTDPLNADTDGDGSSDGDELYTNGTDPLDPDSV